MTTSALKRLAAALCIATLAAVPAQAALPQSTTEEAIRPTIGETTTREVGEPMFEMELVARTPGIRVGRGVPVPGPLGGKVIFEVDEIPAVNTGRNPTYCGPGELRPVLSFPVRDDSICVTAAQLAKGGAVYPQVMITTVSPTNLRQQLLYQGRSGSTVRVSYREFLGDLSRPAFTQDLTFDLSTDPIIGVKGSRAEILEATNTQVTFRLIQPFARTTR